MAPRLPFPGAPPPRTGPASHRTPRAPEHLGAAGRELWSGILRGYELDESHQRAILASACEAADRQVEAREAIERDGAYIDGGRYGMKAHPGLAVERDSRLAMVRCLRELGLDLAKDSAARPPSRWTG
jgi:P27 family predicted phage terminase small subunit